MQDVDRSDTGVNTGLADARQSADSWHSESAVGTLHLSLPTTMMAREWLEVAIFRHRPQGAACVPDATVTMYHHTGARYRAWQLSRAEALDLVALLLRATQQAEVLPVTARREAANELHVSKGRTCQTNNASLGTTGLIRTC